MKIYRVVIGTELLVECDSESDAEKISLHNLKEEVNNGLSTVIDIVKVESVENLKSGEFESYPWRSCDRRGEKMITIGSILNTSRE